MFVWDSANIGHIAEHDVTPEEAEQVLENRPFDLSHQLRNGEERIVHLGETRTGRILRVVVAPREGRLRVVTAWPADRKDRQLYVTQKGIRDHESPRNP